jgi:DNA polymerase-3 subunit alpha
VEAIRVSALGKAGWISALLKTLGGMTPEQRGTEGPRINLKEVAALDGYVCSHVRKVTWLLHPTHRELPAFLRLLRETLNKQSGDTRVEFGFLFEDRVASIAEVSGALSWKLNAPAFQALRAHPAVAGVQIETKRLELKNDRKWSKKT